MNLKCLTFNVKSTASLTVAVAAIKASIGSRPCERRYLPR